MESERGGKEDNIKIIKGIGEVKEKKIKEKGIYNLEKIDEWKKKDIEKDEKYMELEGRIEREEWVGKERKIEEGKENEFEKRVEEGDVK